MPNTGGLGYTSDLIALRRHMASDEEVKGSKCAKGAALRAKEETADSTLDFTLLPHRIWSKC
jgi:hypothetical protein